MSGRMNFDFTFGQPGSQSGQPRESDDPLRILILANLSGAVPAPGAKARVPLPQRPFVRIDIDNFDEILRRHAPRVQIGSAETSTLAEEVQIQEMDDFRPERLCEKLPSLQSLAGLRKSLFNPSTFDQAAAQLRQQLMAQPAPPVDPVNKPPAPSATSAEDDAATLQRILGQSATPASGKAERNPADRLPLDIQRMIEKMVQPYVVPAADPSQKVYVAAANNALSDRLRAVLHDRSFQRLEATWRSLRELVSNIEADSEIQIHLLDVTSEELLQDVPTDDQKLQQWSLFRRLTDHSTQSLGTVPWALIVGDITIAARPDNLALLGALTATAQHLETPFIAAGHSSLLGCSSLTDGFDPADWKPLDAEADQYWQALRRSPAAAWVGLVCPRVLLRLPYGKETDEVDAFEFEEFSSTRNHEDYLWGNSAYLCAQLVAQAFAEDGWSMQLPSQTDIGDRPAYTYREDGEDKLQPCAEVAFGERVGDAFMQRGMMPLISWKDRNAVRFVRFQSIANPPASLEGPWS